MFLCYREQNSIPIFTTVTQNRSTIHLRLHIELTYKKEIYMTTYKINKQVKGYFNNLCYYIT